VPFSYFAGLTRSKTLLFIILYYIARKSCNWALQNSAIDCKNIWLYSGAQIHCIGSAYCATGCSKTLHLSYFIVTQRANQLHRHRISCNWALKHIAICSTLVILRAKTHVIFCTGATLPLTGVNFALSCRRESSYFARESICS